MIEIVIKGSNLDALKEAMLLVTQTTLGLAQVVVIMEDDNGFHVVAR